MSSLKDIDDIWIITMIALEFGAIFRFAPGMEYTRHVGMQGVANLEIVLLLGQIYSAYL